MLYEKKKDFWIKVQKVNTKFRNGHKISLVFSCMLFLDKKSADMLTFELIQHKKLLVPQDKAVNRPDFFHVEGFSLFVVV